MDGRIYTFYSYKGGVGRSMALANVAEYFYLQGLKVLIVDWDLEAPGLESFFYPASPDGVEKVRSRLGLLDLLTEYKRNFEDLAVETPAAESTEGSPSESPSEPVETFEDRLVSFLPMTQFLHQVHGPSSENDSNGLWLMTAGWRHGDRFKAYAETVQSFDWADFYQTYRGHHFFDWLALQLKQAADVVLIDSRTGVTEMGGVCARHLADVVVSFCAPNMQNIDGVDRMVKSFDREDVQVERKHRPLDSLVVPTRVEGNETEKLNRFVKHFEEVIDHAERRPPIFNETQSSFWQLQIPYVPAYAFGERRVFGPEGAALTEDPRRQLEEAYAKLAAHLALLAPDAHPLRLKLSSQLRASFPQLLPPVVISYAKADGRELAATVRQFFEVARVATWPDLKFEPGEQFDFSTTIGQARFLVIIGTPATHQSVWVREEVRLARQLGKVICVVQTTPPTTPPLWLKQSALFFEGDAAGLEALLACIRNPPPVLRVPNQAPRLERFILRPALMEALKTALLEASTQPLSSVFLAGMGGSGKTALAAMVCHDPEVVGAYPGGIVWLDGSKPLVPALSAALTGDASVPAEVLQRRLGSTSVLVVIDDATHGTPMLELRELIERGTILFIARNVTLVPAGVRMIFVGSMESAEAMAMVSTGHMLSETGERHLRAVIAAVDHWPLALSLARNLVLHRIDGGASPDEAWTYAREMLDRHGVTAFDSRDTTPTVRGALQTAFRDLAAKPETEKAMLRLAEDIGTTPFKVGDAYAVVFQTPATETRRLSSLEAILRDLVSAGLLQYDGSAYRVHPVIHRFLVDEGRIETQSQQARKERTFSSSDDKRHNADVAQAHDILAGRAATADEMLSLAKRLKAARYFDFARRLLARVRNSSAFGTMDLKARVKIGQQLALCTYKDANLIPEHRFHRALEVLCETDDLATTRDQETLGLAGAIYKYRWMHGGNRDDLERSLAYYQRGADEGIAPDFGYTAINAAYLLDLIASQEEAAGTRTDRPDGSVFSIPGKVLERRAAAAELRKQIVHTLSPAAADSQQWWMAVTLAEACFGLGTTPEGEIDAARYDEARYWFREAIVLNKEDWEYETTARQLASIASMQGKQRAVAKKDTGDAEWQCLRVFLGNRVAALRSLAMGKAGLALSGGGFRASLFHIGVLARLAEADLLRHVEVLSCVSGGSIIGAHYYLELRRLLESKPDDEIKREDYIEVVRRVERDFLAAVQRNLRTLVAWNPFASFWMMVSGKYSRTRRIGGLYEKVIYSKVDDGRRGPRFMDDMRIVPHGEQPGTFAPKLDNWTRAAKVPELILNATSVNSGHNWQFTASWMGEPPSAITESIDGNDRLRRMYYWEAPKDYRKVRLGHAVAASSCVPGLFEPLSMPGLYPKHVVELVDGGVHDNQGLAALIEQQCKIVLVSDASGQMGNELQPATGVLSIFQRSNDMLMARVRESQFRELIARREAAALSQFVFVHLKKDLQTDPVDWVDCPDPYEPNDDSRPEATRGPLTGYGILKSQQEQLAAIRTDLDSFSDLEACALMYSGYRMIDQELKDSGLAPVSGESAGWRFQDIEAAVGTRKNDDLAQRLTDNLRVARFGAWKVLRPTAHKVSLGFAVVALMAALVAGFTIRAAREYVDPYATQPSGWSYVLRGVIDAGTLVRTGLLYVLVAAAAVLVAAVLTTLTYRLSGRKKSLSQTIMAALLIVFAPLAWLHILFFDPWYLRWGKLPEMKRRHGAP